MTTLRPHPPLKIVLAIDGSEHSRGAVRQMTEITWPLGTTVRVLAIVPQHWRLSGLSPERQGIVDRLLASGRRADWAAAQRLATQVADQLHAHGLTLEADTCEGHPVEIILERAAALSADLIVIGAKALSIPCGFPLGRTAYKLAHRADCSVLVTRPPQRAQQLSLMLAADGTPQARRAAEFMCHLSLPRWAEVTVVSVVKAREGVPAGDLTERLPVADWPEGVWSCMLDTAEARIVDVINRLSACDAKVRRAIRCGQPATEILSAARELDADLIAVGVCSQARTTPCGLGSVARKVVRHATCSVLVAR